MMGISPRALGEWWKEHDHVAAIGANCGVGPGDAVAAAWEIEAVSSGTTTITKANCGIPLYQSEGGLTYPIGPDKMGEYVELALRSGARIIGACCGSTPDHIAAIREAVDAYLPGERPALEEVAQRLDASVRPQPAARRERRRATS
jgi:5-methyltetrahydrofolate--homocysteine methyltransferase